MTQYAPLFLSEADCQQLRRQLKDDSLIGHTLRKQIEELERYLTTSISVPGHGEGGGEEHTRHKLNYRYMNLAGRLWLITGEARYCEFVSALLLRYAERYPTLGRAVSKDSNPPGRLFHQTLNEHMWLLYVSEAYHCVRPTLGQAQQESIETNLLRLMANEATTLHASTFDIVHNHGLWSVAAVAICGYVLNDQGLVDKALYGLKMDSSGGFFAQLDGLFSLDGYYIEGSYYHRFALRPLLLLAEAIERRQPELHIYQYRHQLIRRACYALFAQVLPDGTFPALNDASKTMNIQDEGVVMAVSVCWQRYGKNAQLKSLAQRQNSVWIGSGALQLIDEQSTIQEGWKPQSVLLRDGADGDRGALSILRSEDSEADENVALLWYGQHGSIPQLHSALNHGHFDGLHLSLFNRGREFLRDYGFGRWVNVEPKFGGRYIPENNSYCKQTVAHNTVVVDEQSQNQGQSAQAETRWGKTHFFIIDADAGQATSAFIRDYYPGIDMQRSIFMLPVEGIAKPLVIDLFQIFSHDPHQCDYCLHPRGQLIETTGKLVTHEQWRPLGEANGYQHLWDCARISVAAEESVRITWLDENTFYSAVSAMPTGGETIIARTGASDPNFNLRQEPAWLLRSRGRCMLFATVFETHGYFDEASETSVNARGKVSRVKVLHSSREKVEVSVELADRRHLILTQHNAELEDEMGSFDVRWVSE